MSRRADLHCHSTCSDGQHTPSELLQLAKEAGLFALSITDHDTLGAYTAALFEEAQQLGLRLYVGVELSTLLKKTPIHILGYGVDLGEEILHFCKKQRERRNARNRAILGKFSRFSIIIKEEELKSLGERTIGRPHIAHILVKRGIVPSIQQAFDRFLGEGKPCFAPGTSLTPLEAIEAIHSAKGKAFIAHPHLIRNEGSVQKLLSLPFDGIECYYARLHGHEKKWLKCAAERGWLVSGGSDFHGSFKPHMRLGSSWTSEEDVEKIFRYI